MCCRLASSLLSTPLAAVVRRRIGLTSLCQAAAADRDSESDDQLRDESEVARRQAKADWKEARQDTSGGNRATMRLDAAEREKARGRSATDADGPGERRTEGRRGPDERHAYNWHQ